MNIVKIFVFCLLLSALFLGCKKEESEQMINVITSKTWKYASGDQDKNKTTNPSGEIAYYEIKECEQDNTFQFREDGTLVITLGTKKCDDTEKNTKTLAYSFNSQSKELIIDNVKYTVVEENKTQFKYVLSNSSAKVIYILQ
jgi:hypothetical protein